MWKRTSSHGRPGGFGILCVAWPQFEVSSQIIIPPSVSIPLLEATIPSWPLWLLLLLLLWLLSIVVAVPIPVPALTRSRSMSVAPISPGRS